MKQDVIGPNVILMYQQTLSPCLFLTYITAFGLLKQRQGLVFPTFGACCHKVGVLGDVFACIHGENQTVMIEATKPDSGIEPVTD